VTGSLRVNHMSKPRSFGSLQGQRRRRDMGGIDGDVFGGSWW
jgi:hypothetical protein